MCQIHLCPQSTSLNSIAVYAYYTINNAMLPLLLKNIRIRLQYDKEQKI